VSDADGTRREYDRIDILHIRSIGVRPYAGVSPIEQAREAIALSLVLEQHGAGLFGRGARPAGVLRYPRALTTELAERLRRSFESLYRGGENSGRTCVLEDGIEFQPLQLSSVDAQFLELRKFQLQEIARIFRVPLHLLADLERTTHSNAEALGQQFLTFCLLPVLKLWQDALRITLLTPEERKEYYVEFLVDDLARADLAARFTAYSQAINAGVLNPNETREMENRPPYAGGETYMRPVNTAPAPTIGRRQRPGDGERCSSIVTSKCAWRRMKPGASRAMPRSMARRMLSATCWCAALSRAASKRTAPLEPGR
jgi:HK97 family phage portal protein